MDSVAAAVRYVVRGLMGISVEFNRDDLFESSKAYDVTKGALLTGDGIGRDVITRVLSARPSPPKWAG